MASRKRRQAAGNRPTRKQGRAQAPRSAETTQANGHEPTKTPIPKGANGHEPTKTPPPKGANASSAHRRRVTQILVSVLALLFVLLAVFALDEYLLGSRAFKPNPGSNLEEARTTTAEFREQYERWAIKEKVRVFEWHARSTKIIFWVSILISLSGIGFAFWQFSEAAQTEKKAMKADELELKSQFISMAFKSRSLATFMLCVSIAYLLIYVTLVYPLEDEYRGDALSKPATMKNEKPLVVKAAPSTRKLEEMQPRNTLPPENAVLEDNSIGHRE